jgi:hypothetical protein
MSIIGITLLMFRETVAICSEIHTKHINTLSGQNSKPLNVKAGGECTRESQYIGHRQI